MAKKILIIGGVAGGMSAAARARRLDESAEITVLERGGFVSFANCGLPYYIAGRIEKESSLLITTAQRVWDRFRITVRTGTNAVRIDRSRKVVVAETVASGEVTEMAYDKLILAVGAAAIIPPVAHVNAGNVFVLRSMEDTRRLHAFLAGQNTMDAVIVGGGFIGLEMAEALTDRLIRVTLVEKSPHLVPPLDSDMAVPVEKELAARGVTVVTGVGLKALTGDETRVTGVELEDGRRLGADLVILSIGVRPQVELARAADLTLGPTGGIAVNLNQQTSDPDIYAVGDVSESVHGVTGAITRIPLGGPANRQGRIAGTHAVLGRTPGPGATLMGTSIVQVFSLAAGIAGLSEKAARAAGLSFDFAVVTAAHHASYYPGARQLRIKLLYETPSGRVLGAQVVGTEGVDKRLDVVSTLLHFGGTIQDLAGLDLAYAPQFGSAKDPLHMAAFVALNQLAGIMTATVPLGITAGLSDAPRVVADATVLLDVRTPEEFAQGSLPGARNIPLENLRERVGELSHDHPIVTFCQIGQRGYYAQRILKQLGFNHVANLKGGYTFVAQLPLGEPPMPLQVKNQP